MFTWRIHTALLNDRKNELAAVMTDFGDQVQWISGHWRELPPPLPGTEKEWGGLALTTLQDAGALSEKGWRAPRLLYFDQRKYDVSYWLPRLDSGLPVLNRGCLFMPAGLIAAAPDAYLAGLERIFIRPDSGLKAFPGIVIDVSDGTEGWPGVAAAFARECPSVAPERMICVAPGLRLAPLEWRFWIINRRVVAVSPYSWTEGVIPWQEPPPEAVQIAEAMANNRWQPDIAYVADVVQHTQGEGGWYLNELNAASTSGLYSVPFRPLLAALRDAVKAELDGDFFLED